MAGEEDVEEADVRDRKRKEVRLLAAVGGTGGVSEESMASRERAKKSVRGQSMKWAISERWLGRHLNDPGQRLRNEKTRELSLIVGGHRKPSRADEYEIGRAHV